jgi:hypothetical protein
MAIRLNLYHEVHKARALKRRDPLKISIYSLSAIAALFASWYFAQLVRMHAANDEYLKIKAEFDPSPSTLDDKNIFDHVLKMATQSNDAPETGSLEEGLNIQITLGTDGRTDAHLFVRQKKMETGGIGFGIDRYGFYVQFLAGPDDPEGYFSPVGHQNLGKRHSYSFSITNMRSLSFRGVSFSATISSICPLAGS